jgi:hypothetical protein
MFLVGGGCGAHSAGGLKGIMRDGSHAFGGALKGVGKWPHAPGAGQHLAVHCAGIGSAGAQKAAATAEAGCGAQVWQRAGVASGHQGSGRPERAAECGHRRACSPGTSCCQPWRFA